MGRHDRYPGKCQQNELFRQLRDLATVAGQLALDFDAITPGYGHDIKTDEWLMQLQERMAAASAEAKKKLQTLYELVALCETFSNMEYNFLYDESQHLIYYWL